MRSRFSGTSDAFLSLFRSSEGRACDVGPRGLRKYRCSAWVGMGNLGFSTFQPQEGFLEKGGCLTSQRQVPRTVHLTPPEGEMSRGREAFHRKWPFTRAVLLCSGGCSRPFHLSEGIQSARQCVFRHHEFSSSSSAFGLWIYGTASSCSVRASTGPPPACKGRLG